MNEIKTKINYLFNGITDNTYTPEKAVKKLDELCTMYGTEVIGTNYIRLLDLRDEKERHLIERAMWEGMQYDY